ncbi:MAG: MBOAT family protein [Candidatus Nitrohelix vancouverensis]|uniref:MBOAT family protein n=1 Tax=Candidatus Nitrohelix vancouverensis TaxID=2705534 RepID=A0A7T0G3F8_9BACT|nr:MAG: MBOAT family protein [Candidatus Nitrohelix vancouverensis]
MSFASYPFLLCLLPLTWAGFYLLRKRASGRLSISLLILASLIFYGLDRPWGLAALVFSLLVNYAFASRLAREDDASASRPLLLTGALVNVFLLVVLKWGAQVDAIPLDGWEFLENFGLPLAFSFFVFQQIAFLTEVARKESSLPDFLNYCLYMLFLPQLLAGPVTRPKEMMWQYESQEFFRVRWDHVSAGLALFSLGFFKKTVLADPVGRFADSAFNAAASGATLNLAEAWSGALAFSFQIYFDLSGYADMAMGVALLFGIVLPWNFDSPYKAGSLIEFWRRWHMTLARWSRDHLYLPLKGASRDLMRQGVCLFVVMILTGLWHGAGLHFVLWGGLHGLLLWGNHAWRRFAGRSAQRVGWARRLLNTALTFITVTFLWVLFRAGDLPTAISMYKSMLGLQTELWQGANHVKISEDRLWFLFFIVWFLPSSRQWMQRFEALSSGEFDTRQAHTEKSPGWLAKLQSRMEWKADEWWAAAVALIFLVAFLQISTGRPFIYFQF